MNKVGLLNRLHTVSRGNLFSIEIPKPIKDDDKKIEELVDELERDGKIKLREYVEREYSIYLHGIIKYASD
ncbi:MAG TPA: hypothetical protein VGI04_08770 [Neobacillus sp.]|jgi:hypothetical protein